MQFDHRMVAYALWLFALLHAADVVRTARRAGVRTSALALAAAVTLQAVLGIVTLLYQAPLALALRIRPWRWWCLRSRSCMRQRLERRPHRRGVDRQCRHAPAEQAT